MFKEKDYLVVGLTTYNIHLLKLSVPALASLGNHIFLIIHNDNPRYLVTKTMIRHLGFKGKLNIINNKINSGLLSSRLNILSSIEQLKNKPKWMMFVNDDDILLDATIPDNKIDNCAIIQNSVVLRNSLSDLLKYADNPKSYFLDHDDENISLNNPNIGLAGTLIQTNVMIACGQRIYTALDKIHTINTGLNFIPPTDEMMWECLNLYIKTFCPNNPPIYMDKVNYILNRLDTCKKKYSKYVVPQKNAEQTYSELLTLYKKTFLEIFTNK